MKPPAAIRVDFAKKLQDALSDRGWTQSELARRMAPLLKESRIGRDNISKYVRGKVLPLPPALEAMAKVLGVESRDLLPSRATQAVSDELASLNVRYGRGSVLGADQSGARRRDRVGDNKSVGKR
jgi:transcriptional regulator with XRE-family HTH domain